MPSGPRAHHPPNTDPTVPVGPLALIALSVFASGCGPEASGASSGQQRQLAPVAVATAEERPITLRRTFSGALEATSEVMVAPRVSGQLVRLEVDIGDPVTRGQTVAMLDDAALQQALAQAEAEANVAHANSKEAEAAHEIADRELKRIETLREQGVASGAQLDSARATALGRSSRRAVTTAQVTRAEAVVEAARIRLAEARVVVDWDEDPNEAEDAAPRTRFVAARFIDEGAIVSAGTPIVSVVALEPILAVVFVPERDYGNLAVGQVAQLQTDAYPGETFEGRIARIAPVFSRATRQVRVELEVSNGVYRLKPGMFVRATLELRTEENATVVPYDALTKRDEQHGVFCLTDDGDIATWRPVVAGIRAGDKVQVIGEGISGRVVTLGQELCDDGAPVLVIEDAAQRANGADTP